MMMNLTREEGLHILYDIMLSESAITITGKRLKPCGG